VDEVDHFLSTEVTHAQYSDSIPAYVPRKF
jgi:hypothetical protein